MINCGLQAHLLVINVNRFALSSLSLTGLNLKNKHLFLLNN